MPWSNVPKELWPKMERCVTSVMKSGKDKSTATAICHKQVVGGGTAKAARSQRKGGK